ncbi:MAG: SPOR domain-containing protein [Burkholderiales bacterium]|nr:SPOR domain-containing protein [Bacteroidia bacterium]
MKILLTIFALTSISAAFSQITINASFPSNINIGSLVDAEVKINKGAVGNFAKYQLDVPTGYMITSVDAKGGNFTFENQRAKIVWVSVPSEAEFVVKLKVQANSDAVNPGTFTQKFYYLENSEKKEVEGLPVTINIGGGTTSTSSSPVETAPVSTKPIESKPVVSTPTESKPSNTPSTPSNTKPSESTPVKSKPVASGSSSEAGMTFKVQIGAYSTEPSKGKFSGAGKVNVDLINGMYKVTTGNFKSHDEAAKLRDDLKAKGFNGFIARYKDGVRIN